MNNRPAPSPRSRAAASTRGRVAKAPARVQSTAHNELIGNLETEVINLDRRHIITRLLQQRNDTDVLRVASSQDIQQVVQRQAAIDNVLDNQDVGTISLSFIYTFF